MYLRSLASLALFAVVCTGISYGQTILGCAGNGETVAPKFVIAWKVEPARIQAFRSDDPGLEPLQRVFSNASAENRSEPAAAGSLIRSNQPLQTVWSSWHRRITTTVFWVGETDDWPYVFGGNRPATNGNAGADLDVSPAVRDYLGITGLEVTDWRFVETREVPAGP